MNQINKKMSIEEFAIHVANELKIRGINTVLVGMSEKFKIFFEKIKQK